MKKNKKLKKIKISSREIVSFISAFKEVNPTHDRLYSNKTERAAAERLIHKFGYEKMKATAEHLSMVINQPYAPVITTPYQLERNLGKLVAFFKREENKNKNKYPIAFI